MAIKVWWAWVWRTFLTAVAAGFVIGFIFGMIAAMIGLSREAASTGGGILGAIAGLIAQVYFLRVILSKEFSDFKIQVIKK